MRYKIEKQLDLLKKPEVYCGGNLASASKRRLRILSTKKPIHLVLKAQKKFNLYKNKKWIEKTLKKQATKTGIKIYSLSIQKDHIHLVVRLTSRRLYKAFIRATSGLIARKLGRGIWKLRPFTRVATWGRGFKVLKSYLTKNDYEVLGLIPYTPRNHRYKTAPPPIAVPPLKMPPIG